MSASASSSAPGAAVSGPCRLGSQFRFRPRPASRVLISQPLRSPGPACRRRLAGVSLRARPLRLSAAGPGGGLSGRRSGGALGPGHGASKGCGPTGRGSFRSRSEPGRGPAGLFCAKPGRQQMVFHIVDRHRPAKYGFPASARARRRCAAAGRIPPWLRRPAARICLASSALSPIRVSAPSPASLSVADQVGQHGWRRRWLPSASLLRARNCR